MEYSLKHLNKNANLKNLKLNNFVETLNLIGLEVDEILLNMSNCKTHISDIKLDLKIPANREDLLNDTILIKEFSTIFVFEPFMLWENLKNNYSFLLNQKYAQYSNYLVAPIDGDVPGIVTYGIEIKNYKNKEIPNWLKKRLNLGESESRNIIELLINLTILEWGQNFNTASGEKVQNLKLERLNNEVKFSIKQGSFLLRKGTVVLKNDEKIISVLGIINFDSKRNEIFLESTFYDIHENILNLNDVNSKISFRYLRRNFLTDFKFSFQRLLTLIELIAEGEIKLKIYKNNVKNVKKNKTRVLKIDKNSFKKFLNIDSCDLNIFKKSNLKIICETPSQFYLLIPDSRKDLTREIDVIEEYARFIGYKNFQEIFPEKFSSFTTNKKTKKLEFIKQFFLSKNFNEIFTTSLNSESKINGSRLSLTNPLNSDLGILRNSFSNNLIDIYKKNLRFDIEKLKFFEIGRVYRNENNRVIEEENLGIIFPVKLIENNDPNLDFFTAKSFIEEFLLNFTNKKFNFVVNENPDLQYHPKRCLNIYEKNNVVAIFGEIHPNYKKSFSIKQSVYIFEFNLDCITSENLTSQIDTYRDYSKYPLITKDLSIIISKNTNFYELKTIILEQGRNLKSIKFFDLYFEKNSHDKVSLGIRLSFQSFKKTLMSEEVEEEIENILQTLKNKFFCELKI